MIELGHLFNVVNGIASTGLKESKYSFDDGIVYVRPASTQARTFRSYINKNVVSSDKIFPEGTLFVSTNGEGSHSYSYVSTCEFVPNSDVSVLIPKIEMSLEQKLFYSKCITANRYKFSYGRKPKGSKLKSIMLPNLTEIPDWVYEIDVSIICEASSPMIKNEIKILEEIIHWKKYSLGELFDIKKGKRLTKADMMDGITPFIGSTDKNNGLTNRIYQSAIHTGNVLTVNYNGSVGEAFYQPEDFWASDDVNVLYPKYKHFKRFNQYIALFIIPIIRANKFKFSYGRKWHMDRMIETEISLPVKGDKLDLELMESFILSLPFSSKI
ncbi:restriction endonuclease subunit S [Morganella morganii]|uniref:restriction endonuclease subunit S n=1 Tax=Morganella morganii TaxID=582 RepID=UPI003526C127